MANQERVINSTFLNEILNMVDAHVDWIPFRIKSTSEPKEPKEKKMKLEAENTQEKSWIRQAPIVYHVTSFLDPQDILVWLSSCKALHGLCNSNAMWRLRLDSCFGYLHITKPMADRIDLYRSDYPGGADFPIWKLWTDKLTHLAVTMQAIYGREYTVHPIHRALVAEAMIQQHTKTAEYVKFNEESQKWDLSLTFKEVSDLWEEPEWIIDTLQERVETYHVDCDHDEEVNNQEIVNCKASPLSYRNNFSRFQLFSRMGWNPMIGSAFGLSEYEYSEHFNVDNNETRSTLISKGHPIYFIEYHTEDYLKSIEFSRQKDGKLNLITVHNRFSSLAQYFVKGVRRADHIFSELGHAEEYETDSSTLAERLCWLKQRQLPPFSSSNNHIVGADWACLIQQHDDPCTTTSSKVSRASAAAYGMNAIVAPVPIDLEHIRRQVSKFWEENSEKAQSGVRSARRQT